MAAKIIISEAIKFFKHLTENQVYFNIEFFVFTIYILTLAQTASAQNDNKNSRIVIDLSKQVGLVKPLNGINNGTANFATHVDVTDYMTKTYTELGIPYTRLHDIHWPYPDVVDIPSIFPLFHLDANDPKNYNFKKTDDYILELLKTGSKICFRLGVSIEHTKIKYYTHPPADYEKWAQICANIVRHYNEGWANGYKLNITYWEIWNEPDVGPLMWSGTAEDYFRLYEITSKKLKKEFPTIKIGTAGLCCVSGNEFTKNLINYCKQKNLPIDFFSWHIYTTTPKHVIAVANDMRKLLDDNGYKNTESHLNEWNYYPGDWTQMFKDKYYNKNLLNNPLTGIKGIMGAAFVASTLMELHDAPVDQAYFYGGYVSIFGFFDEYGIPTKQFYAYKAFKMLLDAKKRMACTKENVDQGITVMAGLTEKSDEAVVMISKFDSKTHTVSLTLNNVPWSNKTLAEFFVLDNENNLTLVDRKIFEGKELHLTDTNEAPSISVIRLSPKAF